MNQDRASTITNSQLDVGYKQTEVGLIPEDWACVELVQLNPFITSGSRGWADFYSEYGDPFVRITNMFRESISIDLQDLRYVNLPTGASEGKRTQLYNGDLLISITADIGIISYVDDRLQKPAYINQHIALVRFDKDKVNGKFISYFLSHESSQKWFRGGTDQGAKAGMSLITVRKIKTAIPPLAEQEAIAYTLSDIDALIESLDRLLTKKRQIKQGAMQELLTGKRRIPGFREVKGYQQTELGAIPDDWSIQLAGEICKVNQGLQIEIENRFNYPSSTSKKYITIQYLNEGRKPEYIENYSSSVCCCNEDILLTRTGNTGIVVTDTEGVFHNNFFKINYNKKILSKEYFVNFLRQASIQKLILVKAGTSTIPDLNHNDFYSIPIIIPPLAEQIEIANILSDMDAEIGSIESKLTKTRQIKQGMMHELLTGRIRLVDPIQ